MNFETKMLFPYSKFAITSSILEKREREGERWTGERGKKARKGRKECSKGKESDNASPGM